MSDGIKDKVVIITGGSSGIGAASAKHLASRGVIVALAARRKDKLDALVSEIAGFGGKAKAFCCDVTNKHHIKSVVDAVVAEHGRLDVIVNNAGIMPVRPMQECNTDEWDAMVDITSRAFSMGLRRLCPFL